MKKLYTLLKKWEHALYRTCISPFIIKKQHFNRAAIIYSTLFVIFSYILLEISTFQHANNLLSFIGKRPVFFLLNLALMEFLYTFFYYIFRKFTITALLQGLLVILFGIANYTKLDARQDLILPADFTMIGEWKTAIDSVSIILRWQNFVSIFVILLFIFGGVILDCSKKKLHKKTSMKMRILPIGIWCLAGAFFHFAIFVPIVNHNYLDKNGRNHQSTNFTHKLYGSCFLFTEQLTFSDKPASSKEAAKNYNELLEKAKANNQYHPNEEQITPNIITIMSESLWDIDSFSNEIDWDVNPMQVFKDAIKDHSGGSISVNIYGGSTANTEFEYLTGLNTKYLPGGQVAYNSIDSLQPSFASYLKNNFNYSTVAIHPFYPTFWNRDTVYPNMGISQFYSIKNMTNTKPFDIYISDDSLSKEIIEKYTWHKKHHTGPLFSFNVSMANHSLAITGIDKSNENNYEKNVSYTIKNKDNLSSTSLSQLDRYINGVYASGQALKELMDYFDQVSEPTVIVLFGDHAPPLDSEIYKTCLGYDSQTAKTSEELAQFYQTPLVIYSNYDLPKTTVDGANASYLSTIILKHLGLPLSNMAEINDYLMTQFETNTKYTVTNKNGTIISQLNDNEEDLDNTSYEIFSEMLYGKKKLDGIWDKCDK